MIKKLILAAAVLAAGSGAAQASTFDFSYTFSDGQTLTGSLEGTLSGDLVTNLSDISVTFDGNTYSGPLFAGVFNAASGAYDYSTNTAVVSTDATKNNFIFADNTDPTANNVKNFFYFFNGATPSGDPQAVLAGNTVTGDLGIDIPSSAQWTLKPVPVPAALPLVISGLGLLAAAKRRRQNKVAA